MKEGEQKTRKIETDEEPGRSLGCVQTAGERFQLYSDSNQIFRADCPHWFFFFANAQIGSGSVQTDY